MKKTIRHEFSFSQPPEKVWEYMTKPELIEQWLMKNTFQPVPGSDFQFTIDPIPSLDFDGIVYCKVLEIAPFERLSYSWKCGPGNGEISLDTIVVWQLKPTDKGTELILEHSGFSEKENLAFYNGMTNGWVKNIQKMTDRLKAATDVHSKV
jgi:uncharacterized protein YndB with AHSA1/START domain